MPREVTEGKGRVHQEVEGDGGQGDPQAQAVELPQGETEASQPEVSADARLPPEEDPAEMEVQDQEDHTRITEPSPIPVGREGVRKRKPSQDREPLKHMVRPSESREEGVGYRLSSNPKGWIKKLEDKARSIMRTSPLTEGTQKRDSHPKSRQEGQHQRCLGHGLGPAQH